MIDLDFFKNVNDSYGHLAGDEVLRRVAKLLSDRVRGTDIVARYGNDRLLEDGLSIHTTVDLDLEREAIGSMLKGLGQADRRQGYRGPLMHVEPKKLDEVRRPGCRLEARRRDLPRSPPRRESPPSARACSTRTWPLRVLHSPPP